jgi:hypothetical protein
MEPTPTSSNHLDKVSIRLKEIAATDTLGYLANPRIKIRLMRQS